MATSPPNTSLKNMRDFFTRDKEKLPTDVKHALALLQLSGLDELEERFLGTDAFLKPWAVFRDSIFLVQPDAMPNATAVARTDDDKEISRQDLLWFYTQFDEGTRRSDPSAYLYSDDYAVIDKSEWGVEAYEKHLFVWLLQVLKVGKARNPWGFAFFELQSVCTAWEAVLVPIVNVVRASYDVKGRRHYGRIALFIEDRCPSGLAFPQGNVSRPEGSLLSPTPYRVVSVPRRATGDDGTIPQQHIGGVGVLTRKHYDEAEKELRTVYPQYGGLVERPKFKHAMDEWLAEQRARADRRRAAERAGEVSSFQQVLSRDSSRSPVKSPIKVNKRQAKEGGSPIKRYSDSIRRSLSRGMAKMAPKEEPKSPLHGVTRQLYFPDVAPPAHASRTGILPSTDSFASFQSSDTTVVTPWPRPDAQRKPSEQSVYTSDCNSNPYDLFDMQAQRGRSNTGGSVFSPMGQLSAIPQPLHRETDRSDVNTPMASVQDKSYADVRMPSYEGNGWQEEISLTKLDTVRKNARTPDDSRKAKPPTRLPGPIQPAPYAGHLRVASKDIYHKAPAAIPKPPQPVAWPGNSPPYTTGWPGMEDEFEFTPPIPSKSPERWNGNRGHTSGSRSQQLVGTELGDSMARIVSKDNIRAALGGDPRDNSEEDLTLPPQIQMLQGPSRTMTPGGTRLQTYNKNLFPRKDERKGTPVSEWVGADRSRYTPGGSYEMGMEKSQEARKGTGVNDGQYSEDYLGYKKLEEMRNRLEEVRNR